MNPVVLTKISKFLLIGNLAAFISFAGKFQPQIRLFFVYLYGGTLAILIITALWEGRERLEDETPENVLGSFMPSMNVNKPKRQYLLSPGTRLELVIGFVVLTVGALMGTL